MSTSLLVVRTRASVAFLATFSLVMGASMFSVGTVFAATNSIPNPSFETGSGNTATGWTPEMSTLLPANANALTISTLAADVHSGTRAAKATVSSWTAGDAKWLSSATSTTGGKYYIYSEWYKSSTTTQIGYFANDGFHWLKDLPAAAVWTQYQTDILIPNGVTSIQMAHILFSAGTLNTDDYSLVEQTAPVFAKGMITLSFDDGWKTYKDYAFPILASSSIKSTAYIVTQANLPQNDPTDYMSDAEIKSLAWSGLVEIGAHTRNHVDLVNDAASSSVLATYTPATISGFWQSEINGSRTDLQTLLPTSTIDTLAYPYGQYNAQVEASTTAAGFIGARSVDDGFNLVSTDKFALKQKHITNTTTFAEAKAWIDTAIASKVWVIFMFHDVWPTIGQCVDRAQPDVVDLDCTNTALLIQIVDYLKTKETAVPGTVVTVHEGLGQMNTDVIPPHIAITSPVNGSTLTHATTTISGTTDDNTSPIVLGLNGKTYNVVPGGGVWSLSMPNSDSLPNGTYKLFATSTDAAHNIGTTSTSFTVAVNVAPVAQNKIATTTKNTSVLVTLVATDTDSLVLTYATTSQPAHGTLTGSSTLITYTPNTDYIGPDAFSFTANDGTSTSNIATISITVNDAPAPVISSQTSGTVTTQQITLTWTTDHPATSRVVWDTVAHSDASTTAASTTPNYGYAHSTTEDSMLVVNHSVTISSLSAGTTYYLRSVSHGSPSSFGSETPITTTGGGGGSSSGSSGGGGGGGGGGGVVVSGGGGGGGGAVLGASTALLTEQQIKAILDLLRSFNAEQSVIDSVNKALHGQASAGTQSTTTTKFIFTKTTQMGSTGTEVSELQKRLAQEGGYSGPISGYFGALTKAAVMAYQSKHTLSVVGIVGPQTRAVLNGK